MKKICTVGLLAGSRSVFPADLAKAGRAQVIRALANAGVKAICLTSKDTRFGCVETRQDALKCADLFRRHSAEIEGIVVTLPNFGDERAAAEALRLSGLRVPVLVHAFPDDPAKLDRAHRRDAFCGKLSVCNNLKQYGIPFSLTELHVVSPDSESFACDATRFAHVCRVVGGVRKARLGAVGARPGAFRTMRHSEKILEAEGISVETLDLSELLGWAQGCRDNDGSVRSKLQRMRAYGLVEGIPKDAALRIAKFYAVLDRWVKENDIDAVGLQCWTSIEKNFGIVPCCAMSMMSESLLPAACEVDVVGALTMYALQLASGAPSALADWNNNFGDDPDCAILFHCSNFPRSVFSRWTVGPERIMADAVGEENAYASCSGPMKAGAVTLARLTTDDLSGVMRGYVAQGEVLGEQLETFGGTGVVRVRNLQQLMRTVCLNGFEHHVAVSYSQVAGVLHEAFANYLGWDVYHHC